MEAVTYTGTGVSATEAVAEYVDGCSSDQANPASSPRPMSAPMSGAVPAQRTAV